jgi:uncharacterized membrane protein
MPNIWWYLVYYSGAAFIGLICALVINTVLTGIILTTVICFIYCITVRTLASKEMQKHK